jgi:hypothetical protein
VYTTVDVTSYLSGDGTYSLALTSITPKAVSYPSREAGSNRPELIVELGGPGGATPTATWTQPPASTPTATPTNTPPPASATAGPTGTPSATATNTSVAPTATPSATATPVATTPAAPQAVVLNPAADVYVDAARPTINLGSVTILRTYASPEQRSYLRFDVSGLAGQVITRATLRLYANGSSSAGYTVSAVPDTGWSEMAVTYQNMPALGSALGGVASHGGAQYTSVDVTGYVTGEGAYAFALTTTSTKAVSYPSREADSNRPELVLELAPAGGHYDQAQRGRVPGVWAAFGVLPPMALARRARPARRGGGRARV